MDKDEDTNITFLPKVTLSLESYIADVKKTNKDLFKLIQDDARKRLNHFEEYAIKNHPESLWADPFDIEALGI
jgi:hypothetical protein